MKKLLHISLWLVVFTGVMVILGFAVHEQKTIRCSLLRVDIDDAPGPGFVNSSDIIERINEKYDSLPGKCLDSIRSEAIENMLNNDPYIREANVVKTLLGEVIVETRRCTPLVRVITDDGESFYLSTTGTIMPMSKKYIPRVLIASGNIRMPAAAIKKIQDQKASVLAHPLLSQIHYLARKLAAHPYLDAVIGQIYVNKDQEFELVPADGDHIIVLGDLKNLDIKFENLLAFYQAGKTRTGEQPYREINLKFINQVVCKK